jgi:preprotein translocase subunit SecA
MLEFAIPREPELTIGPYAERRQVPFNSLDQVLLSALERVRLACTGTRSRYRRVVRRIESLESRFIAMRDPELLAYGVALRPRLLREGLKKGPVDETFALVREVTRRRLGLRHYPVQLMGGLVMVDGGLAEMRTGEGKTIVALLPAITVALTGRPVHIVTVNDYLARRDSELLKPVYEALGLTVGLVQSGQTTDVRKEAYACDVTYCTNKELVFDYLRDRIAFRSQTEGAKRLTGQQAMSSFLLRGLHYALIDEADSVLIDEARTPLIISAEKASSQEADRFIAALSIAGQLVAGRDFEIASESSQVRLLAHGMSMVADQMHRFEGVWRSKRARDELIRQALTALHVLQKDKSYIVNEGKVQIVDEYTGRIMADRSWEGGLHQLVECKERCELTNTRVSLAQITYQRFFRRYARLAGMTGTAREVAGELRAIYGLRTVPIPSNRPSRRINLGTRTYRTSPQKWDAVVDAALRERGKGRPVLIGTRSVAASELIAARLTDRGCAHVVLNARQDQAEAETVSTAGQSGRITVATNMAGRGTDILLPEDVEKLGGLHVILTEYHESARIDRQLIGRAGRQGDAGSSEAITSLEDELFLRHAPTLTRWLSARTRVTVARGLGSMLRRVAQRAAERYNGRIRRQVVRRDQALDRTFAFAGRPD